MTALAARVDAILAAHGATPAVQSLTVAVHCRACRHDRVVSPGLEVIAIDQPTAGAALAQMPAANRAALEKLPRPTLTGAA